MNTLRRLSVVAVLAAGTFEAAFAATRHSHVRPTPPARAATADLLSDSVRLAAIDLTPGRQLIAYVIGSSRCASCSSAELKTALGSLRRVLRASTMADARSVRVVGVAINTDVPEGLKYLSSVGLTSFDEISVGDGWQNQHIVELIWRAKITAADAPQVILISREMRAALDPVDVHYGPDSVVKIVVGHQAIVGWINGGAALTGPSPVAANPSTSGSRNQSHAGHR